MVVGIQSLKDFEAEGKKNNSTLKAYDNIVTTLKSIGSMSSIDLNPFSSVVISLIEEIFPPVIMKTLHLRCRRRMLSDYVGRNLFDRVLSLRVEINTLDDLR